jgi:multiple sugar transport system substrate-binding protein
MKRILVLCLAAVMLLGMMSFATAEGDPITITVLNWNGGTEQARNEQACAQYMAENPGIIIDFQVVTDNYMAKLNTLSAAGNMPDIYYIAETNATKWGLEGAALDLAPLYEKDGINMKEHFIEAAMFGSGDSVYGLAYGVVNIVLYYNKDMFDAAGLPYPSTDPANPMTWDEYVETAIALTEDFNGNHPDDPGFDEYSIKSYGTRINNWFPYINAALYSNGASFFTEDGMDFAMDSEAGTEVIRKLADLYLVHKCAPSVTMASTLPSNVSMFKDGQLAMYTGGSYEYPNFIDEGIDVGVAVLPAFKDCRTVSWASCNEISATTAHPEEVFRFFRWWVEAETNPLQIVSNFPNTKAFYEDPVLTAQWLSQDIYNDDFKTTIPALFTGDYTCVPEPVTTRNAAEMLDEVIMPGLDPIWMGEVSVEEGLANIRAALEGMYEGKW